MSRGKERPATGPGPAQVAAGRCRRLEAAAGKLPLEAAELKDVWSRSFPAVMVIWEANSILEEEFVVFGIVRVGQIDSVN